MHVVCDENQRRLQTNKQYNKIFGTVIRKWSNQSQNVHLPSECNVECLFEVMFENTLAKKLITQYHHTTVKPLNSNVCHAFTDPAARQIG